MVFAADAAATELMVGPVPVARRDCRPVALLLGSARSPVLLGLWEALSDMKRAYSACSLSMLLMLSVVL